MVDEDSWLGGVKFNPQKNFFRKSKTYKYT